MARRKSTRTPPRRSPPKPVKFGDQRFSICPGSGSGLHGAIALEITRTGPKRRPTIHCAVCKFRGFHGPKMTSDKGLTREAARAYGAAFLDEIGN